MRQLAGDRIDPEECPSLSVLVDVAPGSSTAQTMHALSRLPAGQHGTLTFTYISSPTNTRKDPAGAGELLLTLRLCRDGY
jgi:hypothetical protein